MKESIVVMLLAAIALVLYITVKSKSTQLPEEKHMNPLPGVPDIVGRPKQGGHPTMPIQVPETRSTGSIPKLTGFDNENRQETKFPQTQEEPDEALSGWEDEEEELSRYAANTAYSIEEGLATGVTYEELTTVGKLLQRKALEISEKETTAGIASKIDGTELMQLLENAIGDASRRIANLLDRESTGDTNSGASLLRNNDESSFDIGDYV